jgi:conjugal transfer ATP-binding protein TraC
LVILELEELKERKDLQAVIIQMVILQITNQVYLGDRKTPTQIILDEAWDMLRAKQAGEFMETAARRLRKYRGGLVQAPKR